MARNRMIKADFWVSEQVVSCTRDARLLFIGLWCFCDDAGVHPASYIRLRMEVFPGDDCTIEDIKRWLGELLQCGLIREYAVDDKLYWYVTGWKNHQKIDKPTYRFPLPKSDLKSLPADIFSGNSTSNSRIVGDCSSSTNLRVSTKEKKRKEKENKKNIREVEASPDDVSKINYSANKEEIFSYWKETMNHSRAKLDKKRSSVIHKALQLGYSVVDLKKAISGCAQTPFNMGKNDRHQIYDDISLIFRDAEHIERFINNYTNPPHENQTNNANSNIMSGVL